MMSILMSASGVLTSIQYLIVVGESGSINEVGGERGEALRIGEMNQGITPPPELGVPLWRVSFYRAATSFASSSDPVKSGV